MKIYRTPDGLVADTGARYVRLSGLELDELFTDSAAVGRWRASAADAPTTEHPRVVLPPIEHQEVWAAGVTYYRSMEARMEEARDAKGGDFYDRVYAAKRPEIFFKATPHRVVGSGEAVLVRSDSDWTVPEPELALAIDNNGRIFGYTVGNDVSARDIEGQNPLYLPQAKSYRASCALGPCLLLATEPLGGDTPIRMEILRENVQAFSGETTLSAMKRTPAELVSFLFTDNDFAAGCYLLTGTGIVPPDSFTLASGDRVRITIDPIGTLENTVVQATRANAAAGSDEAIRNPTADTHAP